MPDALTLATAFSCLFFAVAFVQSGSDKVFDWSGNAEWLADHFAESPLKGRATALLAVVTVVELAAGLACLAGVAFSLSPDPGIVPTVGLGLSCLALTMLFFGQRVAKDYPGAAVLAAYFAVALAGLLATGLSARA
jgi:hypothetical protein